MIVHVTAEHIAAGLRNSCRFCPIALALGPGSWVGKWCAHDKLTQYNLSDTATAFVVAFDSGFAVEPCTLELEEINGPVA